MDDEHDSTRTRLMDEEKFEDFSDADSVELDSISSPARKRNYRIFITAIVAGLALLFLVSSAVFRHRTSQPRYNQCGTSAAEARDRGCVFEATGFTWLPKECYDKETESEFLQYVSENNLNLYHDHKYTKLVSMEEVRKGEGKGYFALERYHLAHCLFLFKKLHRAYASGKTVDGYIISLGHTAHCVNQSLSFSQDSNYRKDAIQFSYIKWPNCGKPGGYNLDWHKQGQWTDE